MHGLIKVYLSFLFERPEQSLSAKIGFFVQNKKNVEQIFFQQLWLSSKHQKFSLFFDTHAEGTEEGSRVSCHVVSWSSNGKVFSLLMPKNGQRRETQLYEVTHPL